MILFIDAISEKSFIWLFSEKEKTLLFSDSFDSKFNESEILIPKIDNLLRKNSFDYKDLSNIVVVSWPWSFTWVRTISICTNTINYVIKKSMTDLSFFDMYENLYWSYPIVKPSSRRDSFIKKSEESDIEIISNSDLEEYLKDNNFETIYWNLQKTIEYKWKIISSIDYEKLIKNIELLDKKSIMPLYLKKPSIT